MPLNVFHKIFRLTAFLFFLGGTFLLLGYFTIGHGFQTWGYIYTKLSFICNYLLLGVVLFRFAITSDNRQNLITAGALLANIPVVAVYLLIYAEGNFRILTLLPMLANPFDTH